MKKIFLIFFSICSITILTNDCQNNLNQATKSVIANAEKLKKKLAKIQSENNFQTPNLTIEQIQTILLIQASGKTSGLTQTLSVRKNAHQKLETVAAWFEQQTTSQDWMNYFAIHNQMITAIQKELETLKACPNLCQEIGQKILTVLKQAMDHHANESEEMKSLEYVYKDYVQLFQQYEQEKA